MQNKNTIIGIGIVSSTFVAVLLTACPSSSPQNDAPYYTKDTNAFNILIDQLYGNVEDIWGHKELLIAGPKDYVSYSEDLQTRAHINFVSGKITIETLSLAPLTELRKSIINTLLISEPIDALRTDISKNDTSKEPFLYNQVLDNSRQPIRWEWRAEQFADELLKNKMKIRFSANKQISYIEINLVANHVNQRAYKFLPLVQASSQRYKVEEKLILAIIEVESNYNPFAVSRSDALGLMQVQQHTAGRDLYRHWGKNGEPTRSYLLDPKNNVDMGTAYLALLRDRYLAGITDPLSMQYAIVTAYNGGAGSVLTTFSSDRKKAIDVINSMTPAQVYQKLSTGHSSRESRNYLVKVNNILINNR